MAVRLWQPSSIAETKLSEFQERIKSKYNVSLFEYIDLYHWSIDNFPLFWKEVFDFVGIVHSAPYESVIEDLPIYKIPRWFIGAKLNYAENLLRFRDDKTALISITESNIVSKISYTELFSSVQKCAHALRSLGVSVGDRVAGYIANCAEAVVAMLATASVGAIWSSASPDFGVSGVLERFSQIQPKILFSINAVQYNGKIFSHAEKLSQVVSALPSLEKVIIINHIPTTTAQSPPSIPKSISYDEFINVQNPSPLVFEQLSFSHPTFILFSSGTTGKPKCIVHSGMGTLMQQLKEHVIHASLTRDDVFFYYTTTGWMMWNWLVSGLAVGCTIILYEGNPFSPTTRIWDTVDNFNVSVLGVSAKYIQTLKESGTQIPMMTHRLSNLRILYSTGSPLLPECFDFVYEKVKKDVLLGSITGGTDIVSLFAGHNTNLPVHRGEIQCRCLGMAIFAWNDMDIPVLNEPGDLVCTRPFPCMPVSFWNDPDGRLYQEAYFIQRKGVWYHGDFVQINSKTGGVVMLGRSDGTLNPNGIRFGSAELYRIVEKFNQVEDSLAVSQPTSLSEERVILFLKMRAGHEYTSDLVSAIKSEIRGQLSARHVPALILKIDDIPYTHTGKKVEIAVKRILAGKGVGTTTALANPESLKLYEGIPELKHML